jgi:GT2 family glycosyltransferase
MAEPAAKIGIVTLTYNSGKAIDAFLASTLAQTHRDLALHVIDNDSNDNTLARLAPCRDPRLVLVKNADNVGVSAANNQGIHATLKAGCSHVLLINNDVEYGHRLHTGTDSDARCYWKEL